MFILIVFRLIYIHIYSRDLLLAYSHIQYNYIETSTQPRSIMFDKYNMVIAGNKQSYSYYVVPSIGLSDKTQQFIKQFYPEAYRYIINNPKSQFAYIKRKASDDEQKILKEYSEIYSFIEYERIYPYSHLLPIIGLVDVDNKGIAGLEYILNNKIHEKKNNHLIDRFSHYEYYEIMNNEYAKDKQDIHLTIDTQLSYFVTHILKKTVEECQSESASAVIMDGITGKIDVIAQYPYYDGNQCSDLNYLKPIAITESHEKGSVFKAFCMISALNKGIVQPDTLIDCRSTKHTFIKGFPVNTWKAHGIIPYWQVISESNNIGIAQVALDVGTDLYNDYIKLGFGAKTGIELPGESIGEITHPKNWSRQSILSLSYGYEISATLLQLVSAWSCFCNNGKKVSPSLLSERKTIISDQLYSDEVIEKSRSILIYKEEKIPKELRKKFSQYVILGKTGTANILEHGTYNKEKQTYTFVGNIESIDKKFNKIIGIYVRISNKKNVYAATIAAPLFYKIGEKIINDRYKNQ